MCPPTPIRACCSCWHPLFRTACFMVSHRNSSLELDETQLLRWVYDGGEWVKEGVRHNTLAKCSFVQAASSWDVPWRPKPRSSARWNSRLLCKDFNAGQLRNFDRGGGHSIQTVVWEESFKDAMDCQKDKYSRWAPHVKVSPNFSIEANSTKLKLSSVGISWVNKGSPTTEL